jgi:uroporphyrinogen III methyltransferase/synthase
VKLASIGPITTATLRQLGLEPTVQADTFNLDGLLAAMRAGGGFSGTPPKPAGPS